MPILRLVEANLLCLGSICGASACSFSSSSRDAASEEEESTLLLVSLFLVHCSCSNKFNFFLTSSPTLSYFHEY